jgi:hypothetical protein
MIMGHRAVSIEGEASRELARGAHAGVLDRRSCEVAALTERHAIADLWSDFDGTWTRTFVSPWTLGDPSERKGAELSAPGPSVAGFAGGQTA